VNRNHLAGYLLLVLPVCLDELSRSFRRYAAGLAAQTGLRRIILTLGRPEASSLVYAAIPPLVCVAALVATTSRGGLLSFLGAVALVAARARSRSGDAPAWALALVLLSVPLSWFGLARLEARFATASTDAPWRALIWKEALDRSRGTWLTGSGYNTFGIEFSRVPAWTLPKGATPWPEEVRAEFESGALVGYRAPSETPGLVWYREAHNDYLQVLVETGVPGLLIALFAAFAVLYAARHDPWIQAALAAVLMHSFVDFDLQIPSIPVLFVSLAALAANRRPAEPGPAIASSGPSDPGMGSEASQSRSPIRS
jgi:O-antigen ligase